MSTVTQSFSYKMDAICMEIFHDYDESWFPLFYLTSSMCLLVFFLIFLLHTASEIPKILFLHKNHWKEFSLQLLVFLCVPFCFLASETTNSIFTTIFTLILLTNLLDSLSNNMFCGKYILLSSGILKTLLKSILPILLLILALAATEFTLRHEELIDAQFINKQMG